MQASVKSCFHALPILQFESVKLVFKLGPDPIFSEAIEFVSSGEKNLSSTSVRLLIPGRFLESFLATPERSHEASPQLV